MQNPTVLFVDDEPDFVRALVKRMQKRNVNALGANSGEEAVEIVSQGRGDVDVVVLDVRMPGMDGIQTLREIRRLDPLIETVMLSGHASLAAAREAMELGAFDYLMKPVDPDELLYKLQDAYQKKSIQEAKIRRLEGLENRGSAQESHQT